jgi:hypothetical protein
MKRTTFSFVILAALAVLFAVPAFAFEWGKLNPVEWFKGGVWAITSKILWAAFGVLVAWLGKGKWNEIQLKKAVVNIKLAVDEARKANDANSPGGEKVVLGEYVTIGEKALSAVLATLRGINPAWIPHWIQEPDVDVPASFKPVGGK